MIRLDFAWVTVRLHCPKQPRHQGDFSRPHLQSQGKAPWGRGCASEMKKWTLENEKPMDWVLPEVTVLSHFPLVWKEKVYLLGYCFTKKKNP